MSVIIKDPAKLSDLLKSRQPQKAPAFPWQDFALQIIAKLNVPSNKRSSVFKVCKDNPKYFIEKALNDTKELCKTGEAWKYFFKIVNIK